MCHGVDDEEEMLTVVNQLLRNEVLFVRTVDAQGTWTGTTLVRRVEDVTLETGETATVVSWSGRRDSTQSAGQDSAGGTPNWEPNTNREAGT
jgi:hypothetical protein